MLNLRRTILAVVFALAFSFAFSALADSARIHWKVVDGATVKLDGKPPLNWSVYQPEKKKRANLILILLGHRYLAVDTKAKTVYALAPSDVHATGKDFETGDFPHTSKKVPSKKWTMRDIGPAESIQLTLGDYGGVLDIQLPHMPDLRPFY